MAKILFMSSFGWLLRFLPQAVGLAMLTFFSSSASAVTPEDFGYASFKLNGKPMPNTVPLLVVTYEMAPGTFNRIPLTPGFTGTLNNYIFDYLQTFPSLNGYFLENSQGAFYWSKAEILGPVTLTLQETQNLDSQQDPNGRKGMDCGSGIAYLLSLVAAKTGYNFAQWDSDGNGWVTQEELTIILLGNNGQFQGANRPIGPKGSGLGIPGQNVILTSDVASLDQDANFMTIAHELSHSLGTVDLYSANCWSEWLTLMSCTIVKTNNDRSVFHMDPWHKMQFGWLAPRIFPITIGGQATIAIPQFTSANTPIILYDPARGTKEYFIVEFRSSSISSPGYDANLASGGGSIKTNGMAVWHVTGECPTGTTNCASIFHEGAPGLSIGGSALWTNATPPLKWANGMSAGATLKPVQILPGGREMIVEWENQVAPLYCMSWVQRHNQMPGNGVGSPGQRAHHAMAFDENRGVVVFFGGEMGKSEEENYYNDTWEYDGVQWKPINTPIRPPARSFHSMTYDPVGKRTLLYGGHGPDGLLVLPFDDVWQYTGDGVNGNWIRIGGGVNSWETEAAAIVWDTAGSQLLRVGGFLLSGDPAPTAKLVGAAWIPINSQLPGRWNFGLAFDPVQSAAVLVGGYSPDLIAPAYSGEVWQYQDNSWQFTAQIVPRTQPAVAFDSDRKRVLIVGGNGGNPITGEQVYEYDSALRGWFNGLPLPSGLGRAGAAMAYDNKRHVMVLMGGAGGGAELPVPGDVIRGPGSRWSDTWELTPAPSLTYLNMEGPASTDVICENGALTIRPYVSDSRPVTWQWYAGQFELVGQVDRVLYMPKAGAAGTGKIDFTVKATDQCGRVYSSPLVSVFIHAAPGLTQLDPVLPTGTLTLAVSPRRAVPKYYTCPDQAISFPFQVDSTLPVQGWAWVRDGNVMTNYAGSPGGSASLNIDKLKPADSGLWLLRMWNACGTRELPFAELRVGPVVIQSPLPVTAPVCKAASFSVQADGKGTLQYQWLLDGAPVTDDEHVKGSKTTDLSIQPLLYAHEGNYSVLVTDDCGGFYAVTSSVAKLKITPGPQWVLRSSTGPMPREQAAMAYDAKRRVTVLFGGVGLNPVIPGQLMVCNDLWEWNGMRWTQRMTNTAVTNGWYQDPSGYWRVTYTNSNSQPVHRRTHAMAYDSRRGTTVLFAGTTWEPGYGGGGNWWEFKFNDLWEWDGNRWTFRGTNGPTPRVVPSLAYDSRRGVSVTYDLSAQGDQVWEWDGRQWRSTTITPPSTYGAPAIAAYDSFRGVTFYGPTIYCPAVVDCRYSLFWGWDGVKWTPPIIGFGWDVPKGGAMAFDNYRRRITYFGGDSFGPSNATWFWDGLAWEQLVSEQVPAPRVSPAAAYDSDRHAMVMFGGSEKQYGPYLANETWELIAVDKPLINEQPASQYVKGGESVTFKVTAAGPPGELLQFQWFKDGQLLNDGGRVNGAKTPNLTVATVADQDQGRYYVEVANTCGITRSIQAVMTTNPEFQVFRGDETLTLLWADPQVMLEVADTLLGPWTLVPGATSPFYPAIVGNSKFFRLRPL